MKKSRLIKIRRLFNFKQDFSPMEQKQSIGKRILHSALVKILIGFAICAFTIGLGQAFVPRILSIFTHNSDISIIVTSIVVSILTIYVYRLLFSNYEKRNITELSAKSLLTNLGAGILLGVVYQSLVILVIYLNKGYTVVSINSAPNVLPYLAICICAGITEELIFRGITFRLAEEKLGSYYALLISAAIFGGVHLMNENSTTLAAIAIAVEAGLLLGTAYMFTRNLWFPIAIHIAWNFAQSGIFGASTSGFAVKDSFISAHITGDKLITGGLFGPEASVQAMAIGLLAAAILLVMSRRKGNLKSPYWKK